MESLQEMASVECNLQLACVVDERVQSADCGVRLNTEAATSEPRGKSDGDQEPSQDYGTQLQVPTEFYSDSCILKYQESTSAKVPGISTYEQQVTLENIAMDRWHLATVQKTFRALSNGAQIMQPNSLTEQRLLDTPHGNMETMIPINIREQITRSTLYWNDGLKPKAPDDCARNAQFKMITVSDYQDGLIVKFQPLVKTAIPGSLLSVNCSPEYATPIFVLLPDDYKEEYTVNQFCSGPGDADLKYFEFVNPHSQQLCYWVVEEDDIVVRTQEEVSKNKLDVHVFLTQVVVDCN